MGNSPMELRAFHFGPPLTCAFSQGYYRLEPRRNFELYNSSVSFDTQWLFPRNFRGRAIIADIESNVKLRSFDGVFRVWKKSDPATTGAYDRESVEYIVRSEEGKKYFHFFKHMLLGSEEHYYVSLLYNWARTRSFVQTLSAQTVWNTWFVIPSLSACLFCLSILIFKI